jgi:hypothetical protein
MRLTCSGRRGDLRGVGWLPPSIAARLSSHALRIPGDQGFRAECRPWVSQAPDRR